MNVSSNNMAKCKLFSKMLGTRSSGHVFEGSAISKEWIGHRPAIYALSGCPRQPGNALLPAAA